MNLLLEPRACRSEVYTFRKLECHACWREGTGLPRDTSEISVLDTPFPCSLCHPNTIATAAWVCVGIWDADPSSRRRERRSDVQSTPSTATFSARYMQHLCSPARQHPPACACGWRAGGTLKQTRTLRQQPRRSSRWPRHFLDARWEQHSIAETRQCGPQSIAWSAHWPARRLPLPRSGRRGKESSSGAPPQTHCPPSRFRSRWAASTTGSA